jgi:4-hydroxy-tetrahydrodipicolinate synthase
MNNPPDLSGVFCAIVTPLDRGRIDFKRFQMHIQTLAADGCDGLLISGTTGEGQSFDLTERSELITAAREVSGSMVLLAGTGCASLPETIQTTRRAYELGVDGVVLVPPFFFRNVTTKGLLEYFRIVFDESVPAAGGAFLYQIPQVTGVSIDVELLERLQNAVGEKLSGVKDSSGDRASFLNLCRHFPSLKIFAGVDDLILDGLQAGAAGCITAEANLLAAPAAALIRSFRSGQDAQPWQDLLVKAQVVLPHTPFPVAIKGLLACRYSDPAWAEVRPPLMPLDHNDRSQLVEGLRKYGLI